MSMDLQEKIEILQQIGNCVSENGAAENEENVLQNFLPLRDYNKLAEDRVFLITGGRGTGKTELFRILTSCNGLNFIINECDKKRFQNIQNAEFIIGYIASGDGAKQFPSQSICSRWIENKSSMDINAFWTGLVCGVVVRKYHDVPEIMKLMNEYLESELKDILLKSNSQLSKWWELVLEKEETCMTFLDEVDAYFQKCGKHIYITYDELDRICSNYKDLFGFIKGLLNFWYEYNNRFTNIKAKIFLRSDLYNSKALQFVDASKLRAYHLELKWDTISLYRLLVKRIANSGSEVALRYLSEIPQLLKEKSDELGCLPCDSEQALHDFTDKLIGKYMGKTPKKGKSYSWVPNHIQDANGELTPRPFLKCFSFASNEMIKHSDELNDLKEDHLLVPTYLQGALVTVSEDRVKELTSEEYQWLTELIDRLKGKTMLMEKDEFLEYLAPDLWSEEKKDELPGRTKQEIYSVLLALGIIMETSDSRVNVPEIYLYGFGLKRKGGIRRPK